MLVYVGNANSLDIDVLRLDGAGEVTPVAKAPLPGGYAWSFGSLPLALSPDGRSLYAAVRTAPFVVQTFRRGPKGDLGFVAQAPSPGGMVYIRTDRTGRFLLGASTIERLIALSPISPDGLVGEAWQVLEDVGFVHCVLPDPSNRHLFAASLHEDRLLRLSFDAERGCMALAEEIATRPGSGPRHLALAPTGDGLYLLNEHEGAIDSFALDPDSGRLSLRDTVPVTPANCHGEPRAADIATTPDGRFVYASERATNTIAGFRCEAGGKLTPIGSFITESNPRSFAIDPQGRFLVVAAQSAHRVKVHAIDPASGMLAPRGSYRVGRNPSWVEIA